MNLRVVYWQFEPRTRLTSQTDPGFVPDAGDDVVIESLHYSVKGRVYDPETESLMVIVDGPI